MESETKKVEIKIKRIDRTLPLPSYASLNASGMDLLASLEADLNLLPMQRVLIPTGISIELPYGYEAQVRSRSGLAIKHGISCLNSPGTIDSDYRGEVKVILINLGDKPQVIKRGDRIAQMVITKVSQAELTEVEMLSETERGSGGFGHTGIRGVSPIN